MKGCVLDIDMQGNGNIGVDRSGKNNDVTWYNTTNANKRYGNCKVLNGSSSYGTLVSSQSLDITSAPLSIFAWLKMDASAGDTYIFIKNTSAVTNIQYSLRYDTTNQRIFAGLESGVRGNSANNTVLKGGDWVFGGFVWDGTNVPHYINGKPSGTVGSYSGSLTSRTYTRIGRRETASGYFKGSIGELWLFNSLLSPQDVLDLYNSTCAEYGVGQVY